MKRSIGDTIFYFLAGDYDNNFRGAKIVDKNVYGYQIQFLDNGEQQTVSASILHSYGKRCACPGCKNIRSHMEAEASAEPKPEPYLSPFTGKWT